MPERSDPWIALNEWCLRHPWHYGAATVPVGLSILYRATDRLAVAAGVSAAFALTTGLSMRSGPARAITRRVVERRTWAGPAGLLALAALAVVEVVAVALLVAALAGE